MTTFVRTKVMGAAAYSVFALTLGACWRTPDAHVAPVTPEPQASSPEPVASRTVPVRDLVQPVHIEKQEVPPPAGIGEAPNGVESGDPNGVESGDLNGVVAAPPPPPPPPPPSPPENVPPVVLENLRIAGDKNIVPDDQTKVEIARSGKDKLVGTFKLCLDIDGKISTLVLLKTTGFPDYDKKLSSTIRAEWRYRPFVVGGKPWRACTAVTFIYTQSQPPPPPPPP